MYISIKVFSIQRVRSQILSRISCKNILYFASVIQFKEFHLVYNKNN